MDSNMIEEDHIPWWISIIFWVIVIGMSIMAIRVGLVAAGVLS